MGAAVACGAVQSSPQPAAGIAPASSVPYTPSAQVRKKPADPATVLVHVGKRPMRVLFAGDSLTYGSYASTRDATFRAVVTAGLRHETKSDDDAVGGPGQTSAVVRKSVRRKSYDLLIVETGTNDAAKERPELLRQSYQDLLSSVRRASPGAGLVCVGSWLGPESAPRVDGVIRSECTVAGGVFVPIDDLYRDPANHGPAGRATAFGTSDTFHPNDVGHAAIAGRILGAVRVDKLG